MADYTRRYPAWHNRPTLDTPIDAQALQGIEDALMKLLGNDTAAIDEVGVWAPASGGMVWQKIGANQIAAGAVGNAALAALAVDNGKLAAGAVDNAKVAAAAAIAYSKLALSGSIKLNADVDVTTALAIARLAGYPTDGTKALFGDGTWKVPTSLGTIVAEQDFTSPTSTGVTTTEATAATVVTAPAFTADGTSNYEVEAFVPYAEDFGTNRIVFVLYLDGSSIGKWGEYAGSGTDRRPILLVRKHVPASGSRTYSLRAYNSTGANAANIVAGAGGSGAYVPGYIRVRKVT